LDGQNLNKESAPAGRVLFVFIFDRAGGSELMTFDLFHQRGAVEMQQLAALFSPIWFFERLQDQAFELGDGAVEPDTLLDISIAAGASAARLPAGGSIGRSRRVIIPGHEHDHAFTRFFSSRTLPGQGCDAKTSRASSLMPFTCR
jgi:hypothetical protein